MNGVHILCRKDDAIQERKAIIKSEYFEKEMQFLADNTKKLMQEEVDRYFVFTKLLFDYYFTSDASKIVDNPDDMSQQIVLDPSVRDGSLLY